MNDFKEEYNLISKYLKDKTINVSNVITSSWCSNVFVVNNEYTFKFPKIKYNLSNLKNESKLTHNIYNLLNTKIPLLDVIEYNNGIFMVYNYLDGVEYKNLLSSCNYQIRKNVSNDLSNFIANLHSINLDNFDYLKKANFSMDEEQINLYKRYDLLCEFLKNTKTLEDFKKSFDYMDNIKLNDNDFCLLHNDLNEGNFLVDKNYKNLTAVIDFSNAKIGNFSEEFSRLIACDYKLTVLVINKYQKTTKRKVNIKYSINVQKMRYYGYLCNSIERDSKNFIDSFLNKKIPLMQFLENKIL